MSNKDIFFSFEQEWASVRLGYVRELSDRAKIEIERIYREDIDKTWLPNKYCKACYFTAIKTLIEFYDGV